MSYKIKIYYHTGDSFRSYDTTGYVDMSYYNVETAKENLKRIRDHYKFVNDRKSYISTMLGKKEEEAMEEAKKQPWFVPDRNFGMYNFELQLNLLDDLGNNHPHTGFWLGYFEHLISGEVVADPDEDDGMSFHV